MVRPALVFVDFEKSKNIFQLKLVILNVKLNDDSNFYKFVQFR